jgi:hypothetical protein
MKDKSDPAVYESVDDVRSQPVEAYSENSGYGVKETMMINRLAATGDTTKSAKTIV